MTKKVEKNHHQKSDRTKRWKKAQKAVTKYFPREMGKEKKWKKKLRKKRHQKSGKKYTK